MEKPPVFVYGGGITGLTVAHELAERGFQVTVIEPERNPRTLSPEPTCMVGGLARTQWARVHRPENGLPPLPSFNETAPVETITNRIFFDRGRTVLNKQQQRELEEVVRKVKQLRDNQPVRRILIEGTAYREYKSKEGKLEEQEAERRVSNARANAVHTFLADRLGQEDLRFLGLGHADADDRVMRPEERRYVKFRVQECVLPGEHGYRFFPSFYRHLFDTMKRTPVFQRTPLSDGRLAELQASIAPDDEGRLGVEYVATGRTVYDNLRPLPQHSLARAGDDKKPVNLSRVRARSSEDVRKLLRVLLEDMQFDPKDIALFSLKIFKYMTSCEKRRHEYSKQSWHDFIDDERYSKTFIDGMNQWPRALVAMSARDCDARTHGNVTLQLLLDQFREGFTDGTLAGPTSEVWLEHWRTYLEGFQNVDFLWGKLRTLEYEHGKLRRIHEIFTPTVEGEQQVTIPQDDAYVVICLPIHELTGDVIKDSIVKAADHYERNDFRRVRSMAADANSSDPSPARQFRHFSGVQFYFEEDIFWVEGHTYYPDSPWGLSSISQAPFRIEPPNWDSGYRGILSVDIGVFDKPGQKHKKTIWKCNKREIAEEVWDQIKRGAQTHDFKLPEPIYYHVDDNLEFNRNNGTLRRNKTPFLMPQVGTWDDRPGEPGHYTVYFERLVFAGTYMKTYTRMTTMEAANESARHAVNAILAHYKKKNEGTIDRHRVGTPCEIWPMEDYELDDLRILKELDEELMSRGLDHFADILQLDAIPQPFTSVIRLVAQYLKRRIGGTSP